MNISERDKKILIAFGILCFLVLSYYAFYSPYTKKIAGLKKEVTTLQSNLATLKVKQSNKPKTEQEIKTVNYQLQNYSILLPAQLAQEQIIKRLTEMESKSGMSLSNYSFGQVTAVGALSSNNNSKSSNNTQTSNKGSSAQSAQNNAQKTAAVSDGSGIQTEVKCSISGTYGQFKALLNEIITSPQIIRVSNISLKNSTDGNVTGTITLNFYGLYNSKAKADDWVFANTSGKDNLFAAFPGYTQSKTNVSQTNNTNQGSSAVNPSTVNSDQNKNYNFIMTLAPESADIPSVILGKSGDKEGVSYVYADSNKTENAELELTEKDGKFYCRYKTELYCFPKNYNDLAEITSEDGQLSLHIVSTPKKNDGDISGVNLKVKNSTSLPFNIKVENDDLKSPRVNVTTIEGKVNTQ